MPNYPLCSLKDADHWTVTVSGEGGCTSAVDCRQCMVHTVIPARFGTNLASDIIALFSARSHWSALMSPGKNEMCSNIVYYKISILCTIKCVKFQTYAVNNLQLRHSIGWVVNPIIQIPPSRPPGTGTSPILPAPYSTTTGLRQNQTTTTPMGSRSTWRWRVTLDSSGLMCVMVLCLHVLSVSMMSESDVCMSCLWVWRQRVVMCVMTCCLHVLSVNIASESGDVCDDVLSACPACVYDVREWWCVWWCAVCMSCLWIWRQRVVVLT